MVERSLGKGQSQITPYCFSPWKGSRRGKSWASGCSIEPTNAGRSRAAPALQQLPQGETPATCLAGVSATALCLFQLWVLCFLPSSEHSDQNMKCLLSHSAQSPACTLYPFFPSTTSSYGQEIRASRGVKPKSRTPRLQQNLTTSFSLFSPPTKDFSHHAAHPAFLEAHACSVHLPQWWAWTLGGTVTLHINNKTPSCYNHAISNE